MMTFQNLIQGCLQVQPQELKLYQELKDRMKYLKYPMALVITCCDSRIDPVAIMHCKPGPIFVARNIANLIHPYHSGKAISIGAALSYAVLHLNTKHIIILGHSQCGGIKACMESVRSDHHHAEEFLGDWLKIVKPLAKKVIKNNSNKSNSEQETICEKESIVASLQRLLSYPWIKERVDQKQLQLHGWYFDLATASVTEYNTLTNSFEPLCNKRG